MDHQTCPTSKDTNGRSRSRTSSKLPHFLDRSSNFFLVPHSEDMRIVHLVLPTSNQISALLPVQRSSDSTSLRLHNYWTLSPARGPSVESQAPSRIGRSHKANILCFFLPLLHIPVRPSFRPDGEVCSVSIQTKLTKLTHCEHTDYWNRTTRAERL